MKMKEEAQQTITTVRFLVEPTVSQRQQITGLYRAQDWWQADDDTDDTKEQFLTKLIAGSHCFAIATLGETVIGMGRAISDGISDAYIQDVTVRADQRRRGVAGRILQLIIERLHADGIFWVGLIAEPGSTALYRHFGFQEMAGAIPMLAVKER